MSRKRGPVETPEYGKMVGRMIRSYGRRVADADEVDLGQMLTMQRELNDAIVAAVHGQRTKWQRSWAYIADAAGITRQAAQQRWGKAVAELENERAAFEVVGEMTVAVDNNAARPGAAHHANRHGRNELHQGEQIHCDTCNPTHDRSAGRCLDCNQLALRPRDQAPYTIHHLTGCASMQRAKTDA